MAFHQIINKNNAFLLYPTWRRRRITRGWSWAFRIVREKINSQIINWIYCVDLLFPFVLMLRSWIRREWNSSELIYDNFPLTFSIYFMFHSLHRFAPHSESHSNPIVFFDSNWIFDEMRLKRRHYIRWAFKCHRINLIFRRVPSPPTAEALHTKYASSEHATFLSLFAIVIECAMNHRTQKGESHLNAFPANDLHRKHTDSQHNGVPFLVGASFALQRTCAWKKNGERWKFRCRIQFIIAPQPFSIWNRVRRSQPIQRWQHNDHEYKLYRKMHCV